MKKKIVGVILILGIIFSFSGCVNKSNENDGEKLRVGVTINPLKDFTEAIGGDKVEVFSIIPDGSDAHSFDPKPKDLKDLINTNMFVYNGLGMEEWIDSVLNTVEGKDIKIVEASNGIKPISISEEDHEHEEGDEDHGHEHGGNDPHMWLSLSDATKQAENIKNSLVEMDPENKDYYESNYEKLKQDFANLQNEYKSKFQEITNKDFVTGHAAFAYLCRDFGLTQKSIADVFGEGELTPKNLETLINYCKENNVKVIFSESTASAKESETLAREVGAKVEKIYSLETKEDDKSYLEGMKYNLETIYNSLKN
ncbi:metal ABC transporter solute-binding protein, Zn/Mn family [Clostridium tertium]|uniref:metal ABC transporter solute-binding protein, Zn/Mn family n=1 Tax=Clostridium tertium TaxID=1559 RepID=UPI001AE8AE8A|nr:zinc ABC transporter substrate-binding protein [Clostridium tertium]MBP1869820.1 zinc transport system substrate-binding protein [Clostridium tertium]